MKGATGALLVCLAVAGCAGPSRPMAIITPQMGGPKPLSVDADIRAYLDEVMKDPASVQIRRVTGPTPLEIPDPGRVFKRSIWGWVACFEANAKNSFGAYTGFRRYAAAYERGQLVAIGTEDPDWPSQRTEMNEICSRVQAGAPHS